MYLFNNLLNNSESGLTANQEWINVTTNNIANINTTRTSNGGPYQREGVVFESILKNVQGGGNSQAGNGVKIQKIIQDTKTKPVYDPTNPDANAQGYVQYPDINLAAEMTNLDQAENSYSANLSAFQTTTKMIQEEEKIGAV